MTSQPASKDFMPSFSFSAYHRQSRLGARGLEEIGRMAWICCWFDQMCLSLRVRCWLYAEMTLFLVLLVVPCCVFPWYAQPQAQELEFVVLNTCVEKEQTKNALLERNPYARVNCSMRMLCRFRVSSDGVDYCAERGEVNLTVEMAGSPKKGAKALIEKNLVVVDNTHRCNLTVEFINMTTEMQGKYVCRDTLSGTFFDNKIKVGESPVKPKNVHIVYHPLENIALYLDPVISGIDLNDPGTEWIVTYNWNKGNKKCNRSKKYRRCKVLTNDGLCHPCNIKLKSYQGTGMYFGQGNLDAPITFNITVTNNFGQVSVTKTFNLSNWVRPESVRDMQVTMRGSSWLALEVSLPASLDLSHVKEMARLGNILAIQWHVELMPVKEQYLLNVASSDFFKQHDFVRNLDEDVAALSKSAGFNFSQSSEQRWLIDKNQNKPMVAHLNITGLPYPGYFYRVSVTLHARYPSPTVVLNTSMAYTAETAPMEGPVFQDTFSLCDSGLASSSQPLSTTCIVYFMEIPQIKRGGQVVNYTLRMKPEHGKGIEPMASHCGKIRESLLTVGGQNNTFVLKDLLTDCAYNLSLQASTAVASSPVTSKTLFVYPAPLTFAPTNIVMKRKGSSYVLRIQLNGFNGIRYFIHHCYAVPLPAEGKPGRNASQHVQAPLNCVTNMKILPFKDIIRPTFFDIPAYRGLMPTVFVSAVMPNGTTSGLQKVKYFFAAETVPEPMDARKFSIQSISDSTDSLKVVISLPYGDDLNYKFGQPDRFAVKYTQDDGSCACQDTCCHEKTADKFIMSDNEIGANLEEVEQVLKHLEADTPYCIGVNLRGQNEFGYRNNAWSCAVKRTGKAIGTKELVLYLIIGIVIFIAVFLFFFIRYIVRHYRRCKSKFGGNILGYEGPLLKTHYSQVISQKWKLPCKALSTIHSRSVNAAVNLVWSTSNDVQHSRYSNASVVAWEDRVAAENTKFSGNDAVIIELDRSSHRYSSAGELATIRNVGDVNVEGRLHHSQQEENVRDCDLHMVEPLSPGMSTYSASQEDEEESEEDTADDELTDVEEPLFGHYSFGRLPSVGPVQRQENVHMTVDCLAHANRYQMMDCFGSANRDQVRKGCSDGDSMKNSQSCCESDDDSLSSGDSGDKESDALLAGHVQCAGDGDKSVTCGAGQLLPFPMSSLTVPCADVLVGIPKCSDIQAPSLNQNSSMSLEDILSAASKSSLCLINHSLENALNVNRVGVKCETLSAADNVGASRISTMDDPAALSLSGESTCIENNVEDSDFGNTTVIETDKDDTVHHLPSVSETRKPCSRPDELQFSIGDILNAAKTSPHLPSPGEGRMRKTVPTAGGDTAPQQVGDTDLQMDAILQAAEACPWKAKTVGLEVNNVAGRRHTKPRSAWHLLSNDCESGVDTESSKETDAETDSGTTECNA